MLGAVTATLVLAAGAAAEVPAVPLDEALRELERQNLSLAQARGRAGEAAAVAEQARAALLPSLAAQASYLRNSGEASIGVPLAPVGAERTLQPLEALSVTGTVRVPLVVPSAWYELSAARGGARAAGASADAARLALRAGFAQAAFGARAAEEVVTASERAVETAAEHSRSADRRVAAGTAAPLDALKARTEHVRRESDLARARAELARARLALGILLGREGPVRILVPEDAAGAAPLAPALSPRSAGGEGGAPPGARPLRAEGGDPAGARPPGGEGGDPPGARPPGGEGGDPAGARPPGAEGGDPAGARPPGAEGGDPPGASAGRGEGELPPEALVAEALSRRRELVAQRARVEAAEALVRAARARLAPQLAASASAFAQDVAYATGETEGWRATLDLVWPIYDGGLREGRRHLAEAQLGVARAAAEAERLAVLQEVADASRDLEVARERLRLAETQRGLASDAAASARRSFEAGVASSLDVLDANDRLYQADVGLADARARLAQARIGLDRAAGR
jgi:outer membrane protein TolC